MNFPHAFITTAIGSFPYEDPEKALDIIFKAMPESPIWPQLPKRGMQEQMEIQYSEGMPRVVVDIEKKRMYFDTTGDYSEEFANFYEKYLAIMEGGHDKEMDTIAISPKFSHGIYACEKRLASAGKKYPFIKVHTTGPCSFALSAVDENKRAIYYNEEFRDIIVKALSLKCLWQIKKFTPFAEKIICFVDEPILSAFGSSTYVTVKREDVVAIIGEVVQTIHDAGAIAGVHCCGNTDWSILIDAGVDIVNLDAYGFGETIALYPGAVKGFLDKGGVIAWGIIPTSEAVRSETVESLASRWMKLADNLAHKAGIDKGLIARHSMLTPSCGTGSLAIPDAERVFEMLAGVSGTLRGMQF